MVQRRNDDTNGNNQNNDVLSPPLTLEELLLFINSYNGNLERNYESYLRRYQNLPNDDDSNTDTSNDQPRSYMHVLQWYQLCHLLFQGMRNNSRHSGSLVDGLRILHSQYLEFHRVATHPLMIEYWGSNFLDGRGIGTPIQLSQLDRAVFRRLEDGSLMNSLRRQSSRTNNEVLELSSSSDDSDSDSSVEMYTCVPRNFRRQR